jgi:hypothetical protein
LNIGPLTSGSQYTYNVRSFPSIVNSSSPSHFASETSSRVSSDAGAMIVHLQYCFLDVLRLPSGDARYASRLLVTVRVRPVARHVYASCLLVTVRVRPVATHVTRAVCSSQSACAQWRRTSTRAVCSSQSAFAQRRRTFTRAVCSSQSAFAPWRRTLRELSARHRPRSPSGGACYASCCSSQLSARHSPRSPSGGARYAS